MKHLTITYGGLELFDGPAVNFKWEEKGNGIVIQAEHLRASNGKLNGGSGSGGALSKILSAVTDAQRPQATPIEEVVPTDVDEESVAS